MRFGIRKSHCAQLGIMPPTDAHIVSGFNDSLRIAMSRLSPRDGWLGVISKNSASEGFRPMCDKHCGDRSRVFGMNEEEVTTHKHEGKNLCT